MQPNCVHLYLVENLTLKNINIFSLGQGIFLIEVFKMEVLTEPQLETPRRWQ